LSIKDSYNEDKVTHMPNIFVKLITHIIFTHHININSWLSSRPSTGRWSWSIYSGCTSLPRLGDISSGISSPEEYSWLQILSALTAGGTNLLVDKLKDPVNYLLQFSWDISHLYEYSIDYSSHG